MKKVFVCLCLLLLNLSYAVSNKGFYLEVVDLDNEVLCTYKIEKFKFRSDPLDDLTSVRLYQFFQKNKSIGDECPYKGAIIWVNEFYTNPFSQKSKYKDISLAEKVSEFIFSIVSENNSCYQKFVMKISRLKITENIFRNQHEIDLLESYPYIKLDLKRMLLFNLSDIEQYTEMIYNYIYQSHCD